MPTIIPLFGSTNPDRIRENVGAIDIILSEDDMAEIDGVLKRFPVMGERYNEHGMKMLDL